MTEPRRTRKARSVSIVTLSALALFFQGCGEDETAYCVDEFDQVVANEECYADEYDGDPDNRFWIFGHGVSSKKVKKGLRISGEKIASSNTAALQSKGGFGTSARSSGFGRTVSSGG